MPNDNNALVLSDNENGTQSATWTPVEEVTPEQKVLIGQLDPVSGTIQAAWNPSSDAAVFKDGTFIENGVYDAQEDDCDGYKTVTVTVPEPVLGTKTITTNGTYTAASEEKTGFSEVTVNVAGTEFANSPAAFELVKNIRNLEVDIPSGVTSIGTSGFASCTGLTRVSFPSSVTSIGSMGFQNCTGLTSVTIPGTLTLLKNNAFSGCTNLTTVTLSEGVTTIESNAFSSCTGLTSIEIPSTVTSIGNYAFNSCTNLTAITINKAEGSITGAPWGATNATVTWTGE